MTLKYTYSLFKYLTIVTLYPKESCVVAHSGEHVHIKLSAPPDVYFDGHFPSRPSVRLCVLSRLCLTAVSLNASAENTQTVGRPDCVSR